MRRSQQLNFGGRYLASELANPDFQALAGAYGIASARADGPDELAAARRCDAIAAARATLIVVPVGAMPSPWHLLSDKPIR